jgi:SCY1-like protein 2
MLQAAAALFNRTNLSQNYSILTPGTNVPSVTGLPAAPVLPPFKAGPWFIQAAQHKLNGKRVSVWSFDKRGAEMDKLGAQSRERVIEVLKAEVSKVQKIVYRYVWIYLVNLCADISL